MYALKPFLPVGRGTHKTLYEGVEVLLVGSYLADSVVKRSPINGNWQPMALDKGIGHVYSPRNRIPFRCTAL